MSLNWQTIEKAVHDWAVAATGVTAANVRWGFQPAAVPVRPLVLLQWTDRDSPVRGNGAKDERVILRASPGVETQVHDRTHTLQIDLFAAVPLAAASAASAAAASLGNALRSLYTEATLAAFQAAGFAIWQVSTVRDLTALVQTEFEGRASCDITINTRDTTTETVGQITSVVGLTVPPSTFTTA